MITSEGKYMREKPLKEPKFILFSSVIFIVKCHIWEPVLESNFRKSLFEIDLKTTSRFRNLLHLLVAFRLIVHFQLKSAM